MEGPHSGSVRAESFRAALGSSTDARSESIDAASINHNHLSGDCRIEAIAIVELSPEFNPLHRDPQRSC